MRKKSPNIVSIEERVRAKIRSGIAAEDIDPVLRTVSQALTTFHRSNSDPSTWPERRRGRVYHAYRSLAAINRSHLEILASVTNDQVRTLRIKGIQAFCDRVQLDLGSLCASGSSDPSQPLQTDLEGIRQQIENRVHKIRESIKQKDSTPADLTERSFRALRWLEFLEKPANFSKHCLAMERAGRLLAGSLPELRSGRRVPAKFRISFFATPALFRTRIRNSTLYLTMHEGYIGAGDDILLSIVRSALRQNSPADRTRMLQYSQDRAFRNISRFILQQPASASDAQGVFYNLMDVYQNLTPLFQWRSNTPPNLSWKKNRSRRTFGVYRPASDTIQINPALDHPDVPLYVLEYVLFHELVHQKVGTSVRNGRQSIHSRQFHKMEAEFPRMKEAVAFLEKLSLRLSRP